MRRRALVRSRRWTQCKKSRLDPSRGLPVTERFSAGHRDVELPAVLLQEAEADEDARRGVAGPGAVVAGLTRKQDVQLPPGQGRRTAADNTVIRVPGVQ